MTQDREELKRRLVRRTKLPARKNRLPTFVLANPDGPDAADAITSLLSDLEAMQEALRPFAYYYDLNDLHERHAADVIDVPVGDLRRARQALSKEPEA